MKKNEKFGLMYEEAINEREVNQIYLLELLF
jgi:hypothetical protein